MTPSLPAFAPVKELPEPLVIFLSPSAPGWRG